MSALPYSEESGLPGCCRIAIPVPCPVDGETHEVMFHFEPNGDACGLRLMAPRSRPFWIAVGIRLVNFYGGWLDYSDYDETDRDYEQPPKSNAENCPSDGPEWDAFQERILAIKPITAAELDAVRSRAAYPG